MNAAETPQWVFYVAPFVIGVILGRWTKAMKKLGELHRASHSVKGGTQQSKNETGSQYVHVHVGAGAGSNVGGGSVGGSGAADVHRCAADLLHGWLPDGSALSVQGHRFELEVPDFAAAFEMEQRLLGAGFGQPTVRADGRVVVVSGVLPSGDSGGEAGHEGGVR